MNLGEILIFAVCHNDLLYCCSCVDFALIQSQKEIFLFFVVVYPVLLKQTFFHRNLENYKTRCLYQYDENHCL